MLKSFRGKAMTKYFILPLIVISLFVSLGLGSKTAAFENQSAFIKPTATPKTNSSVEIEDIIFNKEKAYLWCPLPDFFSENPCPKDMSIKVNTIVRNVKKSKNLVYDYVVSGGRIIGEGANVVWDFEGTRPGTYSITVKLKESNKFRGKPVTKTFEFRDCPSCDLPCVCPTLSVSGGGDVKAGETVTFEANLSGGNATDIKYSWTVSQGEIIEGQGTASIKVKTTQETSETIEATVEIDGPDLCFECPRTASETATIIK